MKTRTSSWKRTILLGSLMTTIPMACAVAAVTIQQAPAAPPSFRVADADSTSSHDAAGAEAAQSRNAARSRMRECGHQWSTMKKNGTASGMTWKDFSQGCLAKQ